jgi:hypothetical protein
MLNPDPDVHRRCGIPPELPQDMLLAGVVSPGHVLKPFTGFINAENVEMITIMITIIARLDKT